MGKRQGDNKSKHRYDQYTGFNQQRYSSSLRKRKLISRIILFFVCAIALVITLFVFLMYAKII